MKQIILFILTLSLFSLNAQIEFSPEEDTKNATLDLTDNWTNTKLNLFLVNNTSNLVSLKWEVIDIDAPEEWDVQFSVSGDGGGSFAWGLTSNIDDGIGLDIPLPIVPNDSSLMELSIRPYGVAGCGTFEVHVSLTSDTSEIMAIGIYNYMINTTPDCITSINNLEKKQIVIFPNPTSDYFSITENSSVKSLDIYNIVGKQMVIEPFQNGNAINVSNFPNGLYLVRMLDEDVDVFENNSIDKKMKN